MVQVIWLPDTIETLNAIRSYLRQFNPTAADGLVERLTNAGNSLAEFPHRGRPAKGGFRELATVPPYVLQYWVTDSVYITRIKHGRQQ